MHIYAGVCECMYVRTKTNATMYDVTELPVNIVGSHVGCSVYLSFFVRKISCLTVSPGRERLPSPVYELMWKYRTTQTISISVFGLCNLNHHVLLSHRK